MRKYQNTESMKEFGRYLKLLRSPDYHDFQRKVVNEIGFNVSSSVPEEMIVDKYVSYFRDYIALEDLPQTFRDLQLACKKRKLRVYPLREVADKLGISKNTLHDYEQGKRYPPVEFIYDYCSEYNFPIDYVVHNWVLFHPNPNISYHAVKRFEHYYTHPLSHNFSDEKREASRRFFSLALHFSLSRSGVIGLSDELKYKVTRIFSEITDRTLAQGKALSPENVTVDMLSDVYEWVD
jgi:transcriptional regulator with XRE-family HTH domain